MSYSTYREMPSDLRSFNEFQGNSVTARIERERGGDVMDVGGVKIPYTKPRDLYNIYSYSTLMCSIDMETGKVVYFNSKKYSMTTSRLQNMLRNVFNIAL